MSDKGIDEIRKQRLADALNRLDSEDPDERKEVMESLPWAYRFNAKTGFLEILQEGNLVAVTQDSDWADMVCEMLNRMVLIKDTFTEDVP